MAVETHISYSVQSTEYYIQIKSTVSGAWIITSGTNAGVMKHVGEAVRDHTAAHGNKNKIVVLGVAPWGVLHDKEILVKPSGEVSTYMRALHICTKTSSCYQMHTQLFN